MTDETGIVYADTAAIVTLVVREAETDGMTEEAPSGGETLSSKRTWL